MDVIYYMVVVAGAYQLVKWLFKLIELMESGKNFSVEVNFDGQGGYYTMAGTAAKKRKELHL